MTKIKITEVPNETSDDLTWDVIEDTSGKVFEVTDNQPENVTTEEYDESRLFRNGVEYYRFSENIGQGENEWGVEAGSAVHTDSWNCSMQDALWFTFGEHDEEGRDMYPSLKVGDVLEAVDDYWGDGDWTIASVEKETK